MNLLKEKIKVEIYSKPECHLCDEAKSVLVKVQQEVPFDFLEVDITSNRELFTEYKEQIPVVFICGKKAFKFRVNEKELRRKLLRFL
ncbi:glutaredoxin family protein [candidate division KSB1 bacterium]|nr:glutaredoxin family protein [candidate division KSB1 bacterium]